MIEVKGKHICERCGQEYLWIARKVEKGNVVVGRWDDINSKNVSSFDVTPYGYNVIGMCPNCGQHSLRNLAENK